MSPTAALSISMRTLLARGALALLLVFAQQTAALHWLSHAVDTVTQKAAQKAAAGTNNAPCDECAGLHALQAFAATAPFAPLLLHSAESFVPVPAHASAATPLRLGFRSRAPPLLS